MKKLKILSLILILVGIILFIYGWIQGMPFSAESGVYEQIYTIRMIRKYVFLSFGCIIMLISYIIDIVRTELEELLEKKKNGIS
ncbi:hypothetical protein ACFIJ5_10760 [Haloimpatiens sp. FM7330]|uniref:hypothetical protein n=1 Tax=Haloimpatiens sp. FM7330 TaxID=3298610 RepID=UPI00363D9A70